MSDTSQPTATVCVLKVTLQRVRPTVWRRLEVPYGFSLGDLDVVIRTAFGWGGDHLHLFEANGSQYGPGWAESPWMALIGRPRRDEDMCTVGQVAGRVGAVLTYTYDLGDNWSHRVQVERVEGADPQRHYPACTAGSGLTPEEDTGGIRLGAFGSEARDEINHRLRRRAAGVDGCGAAQPARRARVDGRPAGCRPGPQPPRAPGGVEVAAATRHPEGRRVLLAAAKHLGDPELSRRLRMAIAKPRGGGRTGRRGAGLRITR